MTMLTPEELHALQRVRDDLAYRQGGVFVADDAVDCLFGLPDSVVTRILGRVVGWGLAEESSGRLVLTEAGASALATGGTSG